MLTQFTMPKMQTLLLISVFSFLQCLAARQSAVEIVLTNFYDRRKYFLCGSKKSFPPTIQLSQLFIAHNFRLNEPKKPCNLRNLNSYPSCTLDLAHWP